MPRKRKLTPADVRKIFKSTEPAAALAPLYGVSPGMVHMIRRGYRYKEITAGLVSPKRARGRPKSANAVAHVDIEKLADAIVDRLVARLRRK